MNPMDALLKPKSIAVIGGGAWCNAVVEQNRKIGFAGEIWPVHPTKKQIGGIDSFESIDDLPAAPHAAFIGVNRKATIDVVSQLASIGAGGAVCFASGFSESGDGELLSAQLLKAAGSMPILGPNCYGLLNALDRVALWPDQHGLKPTDRGVAIIMQSSNIAINVTMQQRGLPIAYVVTAGNQTQRGLADIARELLHDERVTALGLYVESFNDIPSWETLAREADEIGKPIAVFKVGESEESQRATISHTASLAGSKAGSDALMKRLGLASVSSIGVFLETLKIFHCFGRLPNRNIASLSCSGGEASVMADSAKRAGLHFPEFIPKQEAALSHYLGSEVQLMNPLDYHTHIWRDKSAMTKVFVAASGGAIDLTLIVLDFPRDDICDPKDWMIVIESVLEAAEISGCRYGVISSVAENLPEEVAANLLSKGVVPLCDFDHGCAAIFAAATARSTEHHPVLLGTIIEDPKMRSEADAKLELKRAGLDVPKHRARIGLDDLKKSVLALGTPIVLKGEGLAHKTEAHAVALNITNADEAVQAARNMPTDRFLIEEMISDKVAELLLGIVHDPAVGFVLTLAAGGTLTELIDDRQSLLVPASRDEIFQALSELKITKVLDGYRGGEPAHKTAIVDTIMKLQDYVMANHTTVEEIEINPLICTSTRAVVADALLVKGEP